MAAIVTVFLPKYPDMAMAPTPVRHKLDNKSSAYTQALMAIVTF